MCLLPPEVLIIRNKNGIPINFKKIKFYVFLNSNIGIIYAKRAPNP